MVAFRFSLATGSRTSALNENPSGLKDPTLSRLGPLQVSARGVANISSWRKGSNLGACTGGVEKLKFENGLDEATVSKRIIISGQNLLDAQPKMDTQNNQTVVTFTLDRVGAKRFITGQFNDTTGFLHNEVEFNHRITKFIKPKFLKHSSTIKAKIYPGLLRNTKFT